MKKFITVCLLFVGLTMFGQAEAEKTLTEKAKETLSEYVDINSALSKVDDIEDLFVHYSKEVAEGSKTLVTNGVEFVEKTVDTLYKESTIVVRQFIIYTSISFGLPILFGIFLLFWLPKLITKNTAMNTEKAEAYNLEIDKDNEDSQYYKSEKKLSYLGVYYKNKFTLVSATFSKYLGYALGLYLIALNTMPFIKVTFFSKLYLVEMLLKFI